MSRRFATTQWTVVLAARDGKDSQARLALEALCEAYWFPLYAYVRRRGHDPDEARDLTQAFFADLLGRDFLGSIDASLGRFRPFLLASLSHFLAHERDKAQALKKGRGQAAMHLLDLRLQKSVSVGGTRAVLMLDAFNTLNTDSRLRQFSEATSATFRNPLEIVAPRLMRVGLQVRF